MECSSIEFYVMSHAVVTVRSERTKLYGVTGVLVLDLDCIRKCTLSLCGPMCIFMD